MDYLLHISVLLILVGCFLQHRRVRALEINVENLWNAAIHTSAQVGIVMVLLDQTDEARLLGKGDFDYDDE